MSFWNPRLVFSRTCGRSLIWDYFSGLSPIYHKWLTTHSTNTTHLLTHGLEEVFSLGKCVSVTHFYCFTVTNPKSVEFPLGPETPCLTQTSVWYVYFLVDFSWSRDCGTSSSSLRHRLLPLSPPWPRFLISLFNQKEKFPGGNSHRVGSFLVLGVLPWL